MPSSKRILPRISRNTKGWFAMVCKMPVERRNLMLRMLVEGNSIRSVCRLMGTCIPRVLHQLEWAGEHCANLLDSHLRGLTLRHVECDEIWTFVQKKQARLTIEEREMRSDIGDAYLFTAQDQDSRLIATHLLGKRSADNARRFMVQLRGRLGEIDMPHASDAHAYQTGGYRPIIQISTDGFPAYPEAVDLAFGPYAKFGVIIKEYKNATMAYTPSEIVGTIRRPISGGTIPRTICTSHVERNNLTIRTFMKRYARLALGFSKKFENLEAAVNLHIAYYNFCWRPGKMRVTPAMKAGITNRLWSFNDLLAE
jgi:IS1 family transposase